MGAIGLEAPAQVRAELRELMARHGEHVVPIWQTDPHPEHAAGARAINQEAIDLLCPGGSGRGQLEQTLAHNNEPVSHFQNLGDRNDSRGPSYQLSQGPIPGSSGGQNQKDIILLKILLLVVILIVLLESPKFAGDSAGCHGLGRVRRGAKQHDLYEAAAYTHVTMGFWGKLSSHRFGPLPRKVSTE